VVRREWGLPDAIDLIRPSVVQIALDQSEFGNHSHVVAGTGFFVSDGGYVLTARHVVEAARQQGGRLLAGLAMPDIDTPMKMRGTFVLEECDIIKEDERHDLALLRLRNNPFTGTTPSGMWKDTDGSIGLNGMYGVPKFNSDRPRDGERVAVSGYPLSLPALITTSGGIASGSAIDLKEVQPPGAPSGFVVSDVKDSYLADVAVNPGNSGGPVYNVASGAIIGVCVAFRIAQLALDPNTTIPYNSGLSIVVPIKYGLELLARHE